LRLSSKKWVASKWCLSLCIFFKIIKWYFRHFNKKKRRKESGMILSFHVGFLVKCWDNEGCFGHFALIKWFFNQKADGASDVDARDTFSWPNMLLCRVIRSVASPPSSWCHVLWFLVDSLSPMIISLFFFLLFSLS